MYLLPGNGQAGTYPWLRNRCLAINNSSLLDSADMRHVPVAWQRLGWNIHISSDISALWAECHISPCLYSSIYLYNQVKEGNETVALTEIQLCRIIHTYAHTYIYTYIHFYTDRFKTHTFSTLSLYFL
jgi:hypothetical protein